MSAWQAGTFECDSPAGKYSKACWRHLSAPGLCVNRRRTNEGEEAGWVVSHERSGKFIDPEHGSRKAAQAFALDLAPLGDWRRGGEALLEDVQLRAAVIQLRGRE